MNEILLMESVELAPTGQQLFDVLGTHEFIVPDGVFAVSAVATGAGRGHGGAGTSWRNEIPVTPGQILYVILNNNSLIRTESASGPNQLVALGSVANSTAGGKGGKAANTINDGGGDGGMGYATGGKGGAGGYTGQGGAGSDGGNGIPGTGGGGGGGARFKRTGAGGDLLGFGGGVWYMGQGASGRGGQTGTHTDLTLGYGGRGSFEDGRVGSSAYGGGGAGSNARGFVRIIWGPNRAFPNTNTGDQRVIRMEDL